jgi:hypothetical protein
MLVSVACMIVWLLCAKSRRWEDDQFISLSVSENTYLWREVAAGACKFFILKYKTHCGVSEYFGPNWVNNGNTIYTLLI